jgi:hypothetical protein
MAIGFVAGVLIGLILGLAFAIAIVQAAGYDWSEVMHRWHIAIVYHRYKDEIDQELDEELKEILNDGPPA